jgi:hypothetical protein
MHQPLLGNAVKIRLDICIHYPQITILEEFINSTIGVGRAG